MTQDSELPGIVSLSSLETPLGRVNFGGRLPGTSGTGFSRFRVYGMHALVLLQSGGGRYRDTLGTNRRLAPGDLIAVFPEVPHQYGPEQGDTWDEIFIAFEGPAFEGWRAHGLDPAHPVWSLSKPAEWSARLAEVLQMRTTTRARACAVAGAVHQLIADALAERTIDTAEFAWLEPARQSLSRGTGAPSLQEIAATAGLGYESFRKAFKNATGQSPARYRRRQRLAQAALMMQRTDLPLKTIAGALGFCDAFHLSKAFKREYGHSPADHRARLARGPDPSAARTAKAPPP